LAGAAAAGRGRKRNMQRGEEGEERKSRLLLLKEGVWAANYGGNDGFLTGDGGGGGQRPRWREREEREFVAEKEKNRGGGLFFVNFGLDFLFHEGMKSTYIYRRWKRAIVSTLEETLSP
jgi:hypothetical protein